MTVEAQQQDAETTNSTSDIYPHAVSLQVNESNPKVVDSLINELDPCKPIVYSSSVLSSERRVESLIRGYVRTKFQHNTLPSDVFSLCSKYVGDSSDFDPHHLMTLKESGTNCCGYASFCGKFRSDLIHILLSLSAWQWVVCIVLIIKLSIDCTALHAAVNYDHTHSISSDDRLVEVDEMLYVGAITDMMICVLSVLVTYVAGENIGIWLYPESRFGCDVDEEPEDDCCGRCCNKPMMETACCLELLLLTFNSLWTVFGIILWIEMDPQHPSTPVVLSWCIIQGTFGVVAPCCIRAVYRSRAVFDILYIWKRFLKALPEVDMFMKGILIMMVINFAKDVAALAIAFTVDCHQEIDEEVINSLDVNSWLFVGGFTDSMISCIVALKTLSSAEFSGSLKWGVDPLTCCLLLMIMSFHIVWTVFGFMFWAEMKRDSVCSDMVISWCVIESVVGVLLQCCTYLVHRVLCLLV